MAGFWIALGVVVLGVGLVDLFLTSLNYDEAGFLATPLCALQWRAMRQVTRRIPRRWRPAALRQATGLQIAVSLLTWLVCVVLGFGFIYYGLTPGNGFGYDGQGLGPGMFSALYLSAAQLATVGTSQVTPETDVLRTLTILETLSGLVLVTLALTFLLGVYQVVRDLSALSSKLYDVADAEDPVAGLAPYFPQGRATGLDAYLETLHDSFASYTDGLRLHHVAYYFQSGRDHFSLPYALNRLGGIIATLRWGLPADHPAARQPLLTPLTLHFTRFTDYLHQQLRWQSTDVPEVVAFDVFAAAYPDGRPSDCESPKPSSAPSSGWPPRPSCCPPGPGRNSPPTCWPCCTPSATSSGPRSPTPPTSRPYAA
ncbi:MULTISPECIES: potassium channel family protein [unclassified Streptomyces]|uniref:potassium channel family protein n=1 Tax=unclassified Streptomyces TaxID=2593676 RepID=UPI002E28862A|nr:potassium channel family protein [Streptomyces sp. NBC_00223]